MKLKTLSSIETQMVEKIVEDPDLPHNVLVQRTAGSLEDTGVVVNSSTVTVRYTGMTSDSKNRQPMVTENTLKFEVEISSQEYYTHNGHDVLLRLLTVVRNAITNFVPQDTGIGFESGLHFTGERFVGITEESQFVYILDFEVNTQMTFELTARDPCVQRGFYRCSFPAKGIKTEICQGQYLDDNRMIYEKDGTPTGKILLDFNTKVRVNGCPVGSNFVPVQIREETPTYFDPLNSSDIYKTFKRGETIHINFCKRLFVDGKIYFAAKIEPWSLIWIENSRSTYDLVVEENNDKYPLIPLSIIEEKMDYHIKGGL